jgi:integrase
MARRSFTDNAISELKPKAGRYSVSDPLQPGHYVRISPSGTKTFIAMARDPNGKQVLHTIGSASLHKVDEARELARAAIRAIKAGGNPGPAETFLDVYREWFKRHVEGKALRTGHQIKSNVDRHVVPEWGGREFVSIKRSDVSKLLDKIEDSAGKSAATAVLGHISTIAHWYASRHDDYIIPIIKGMRRVNPSEIARDRILNDDELRAVWLEAEKGSKIGSQLCLLTAQRQGKVSSMRWDDISDDGVWSIPTEKREKGAGGKLKLPDVALDIIRAQPRFASNKHVFAGAGAAPRIGWGWEKGEFDKKVPLPNWRLHDLRRTARSLMSRAGVRPDIAERVLGHVQSGVLGTYDRHDYKEEKGEALKALAGQIARIVHPIDNVIELPVTAA